MITNEHLSKQLEQHLTEQSKRRKKVKKLRIVAALILLVLIGMLIFLQGHTFNIAPPNLPDEGKPALKVQTAYISHPEPNMVRELYDPYMLEVTSIHNDIMNEWNREEQVSGLTTAVSSNRLKNFQDRVPSINKDKITGTIIELMDQQADTVTAMISLLGKPILTEEELYQVYTYESKFQATHILIKKAVYEQSEDSYQNMRA